MCFPENGKQNDLRRGHKLSHEPQISVILPARNEARNIAAALDDLRRQSVSDLEILVVDDGSTDETAAIVRAAAVADPRVRLYSQRPRGIVAALNHGLAAARGRLVARMDGDDRCTTDRLEQQMALLRQNSSLALVSCLIAPPPGERYAGGYAAYAAWVNGLIAPDQIFRERFIECPVVHPTLMLETSLLRSSGGWREGAFPEDYDLILRLLAQGYSMAKVPRTLYFWRDHPRRFSRLDSRYAPEAFAGLKAEYLSKGPLQGRMEIVVWGAGKISGRAIQPLMALGHKVKCWIDIDPRKIGRHKKQAPICPPEALADLLNFPLLIYVGSRGARALIRPRLTQYGFIEGQNAWFCA